jgi:hypothetical protein
MEMNKRPQGRLVAVNTLSRDWVRFEFDQLVIYSGMSQAVISLAL